jgi:hypothetical protein
MINGQIYVILAAGDVTPRLLNLSTSTSLDVACRLPNGRVVLEYPQDASPHILDYPWYSGEDIVRIRSELEASQDSPWWRFWG